jgi:hypothetical protein
MDTDFQVAKYTKHTKRWGESPREPPLLSIHQHEHGGLFGGFDHILEFPVSGGRFLELGGNFGDGLEETQEKRCFT